MSAVTGWEVASKAALGRLRPRRTVLGETEDSGFEELPVRLHHTEALGHLPWHHRHPFDRMLVARARAEGLTPVTRDPVFDAYRVKFIRA